MKSEEIIRLLDEARTCDGKRFTQIMVAFGHATAAYDAEHELFEASTPAAWIETLIGALLVQVRNFRPDSFPALYPVFKMACGDRDQRYILADLDDAPHFGIPVPESKVSKSIRPSECRVGDVVDFCDGNGRATIVRIEPDTYKWPSGSGWQRITFHDGTGYSFSAEGYENEQTWKLISRK